SGHRAQPADAVRALSTYRQRPTAFAGLRKFPFSADLPNPANRKISERVCEPSVFSGQGQYPRGYRCAVSLRIAAMEMGPPKRPFSFSSELLGGFLAALGPTAFHSFGDALAALGAQFALRL